MGIGILWSAKEPVNPIGQAELMELAAILKDKNTAQSVRFLYGGMANTVHAVILYYELTHETLGIESNYSLSRQ